MKTTLSVSAFVLGVVLVGVGHASAVSINSPVDSAGILYETQNYQGDEEREEHRFEERDMFMIQDHREERERDEYRRFDQNGEDMRLREKRRLIRPFEVEVGPDGCSLEEGCEKKVQDNDEMRELEKKLKEIHKKIEELRYEAEKIQNILNQGFVTLPSRPVIGTPQRCTREYIPVCGLQENECDGNSEECREQEPRTFSNRCEVDMNNAKILYIGACTKIHKTGPGVMQKLHPSNRVDLPTVQNLPNRKDIMCTREYAPVCAQTWPSNVACKEGFDCMPSPTLKTYSNECEAKADSAKVLYKEKCHLEGGSTEAKEVKRAPIDRDYAPRSHMKPMESFPLNSSAVEEARVDRKIMPIRRSTKWETILKYFSR